MNKKYADVLVGFDEDGNIKPLAVIWNDGREFEIDQSWDDGFCAAETGGAGHRFTIRIVKNMRHLYLTNDYERNGTLCWLVERIV